MDYLLGLFSSSTIFQVRARWITIGKHPQHPEFIILDPQHGILILEVKDYRLSTIIEMN
jgi:hypothetical protein